MMVVAAAPFPSFCCCSQRRPALHFSSSRITLDPRSSRTHVYRSIPQLDLGLDSSWSGLKRLGVSSRQIHRHREKKGKCRGVVYASLFGVGAPEALVIGVVALLVFGPKGLAEVARNLGKTLRAFQPTIRELQEVSREFKSTLEREIGLDEVASSTTNNSYRSTSLTNENKQAVVDPNGTPTTKPYSSEELLKVTEEQLAAAAIKPQTEASNTEERPQEALTTSDVETTKSEVTISPASTESAAQIPSSEKAEK